MKRGVPQHPKFKALRRALGISDRETVGTLELLWHATEQFHDDGGIGRWSDASIAGAIDWHGGDAGQLVRTLVDCGWLDEVKPADGDVRLAVHDWLSHAANHVWSRVKKRVERANGRGEPVPPWLQRQWEKAKVERARDQAGGDDGDGRESRESRESREGRLREPEPTASGRVRPRPAASDPNPRPKAQDPGSSGPRPDGEGVAAAASAPASAAGAARPAPAAGGDGSAAVIEFLCQGNPQRWGLTADHLAELVAQWPGIDVEPCLRELAQRQARETGLRRTARGMSRYLQTWLSSELHRYRKFVKPGAVTTTARTNGREDVRARAARIAATIDGGGDA